MYIRQLTAECFSYTESSFKIEKAKKLSHLPAVMYRISIIITFFLPKDDRLHTYLPFKPAFAKTSIFTFEKKKCPCLFHFHLFPLFIDPPSRAVRGSKVTNYTDLTTKNKIKYSMRVITKYGIIIF